MGKIIFILGGARSGKSKYALDLAGNLERKIAFIATCQPKDKEMKRGLAFTEICAHLTGRPLKDPWI